MEIKLEKGKELEYLLKSGELCSKFIALIKKNYEDERFVHYNSSPYSGNIIIDKTNKEIWTACTRTEDGIDKTYLMGCYPVSAIENLGEKYFGGLNPKTDVTNFVFQANVYWGSAEDNIFKNLCCDRSLLPEFEKRQKLLDEIIKKESK